MVAELRFDWAPVAVHGVPAMVVVELTSVHPAIFSLVLMKLMQPWSHLSHRHCIGFGVAVVVAAVAHVVQECSDHHR